MLVASKAKSVVDTDSSSEIRTYIHTSFPASFSPTTPSLFAASVLAHHHHPLRCCSAALLPGVIHTDFEKGFICAEVMTFEDLKELGDEEAVKKAGKLRQQGKKYVVQDADVIFFKVRACVRGCVRGPKNRKMIAVFWRSSQIYMYSI